jgi:hypothetical protein
MKTKEEARTHKAAIDALDLWGDPPTKVKLIPDGYNAWHYEVWVLESYMDVQDVKTLLAYADQNDLHVELYAHNHTFHFAFFGGQNG